MAAELEKLAHDLQEAGYEKAGKILKGVREGLRQSQLIPEKLSEKEIWSPSQEQTQNEQQEPWLKPQSSREDADDQISDDDLPIGSAEEEINRIRQEIARRRRGEE